MKIFCGVNTAVFATMLLLNGQPAVAAGSGSALEAEAMLEKAVAAIKTDEAKALQAFNHGESGFKDRDLYVFCANASGRVDAHIDQTQLGHKLQDLYDIDGVAFGLEMMSVAQAGEIKAVDYMWPKPGTHTPAQKISFVTRVADQVCGVGYYK
jgi:signal transduction histidine kinase